MRLPFRRNHHPEDDKLASPGTPPVDVAAALSRNLARAQANTQRDAPDAPYASQLLLLRDWQSRRLTRTYADLAADPRFSAAFHFFLGEVYTAPRDFTRPGEDVQHIGYLALKFLPGRVLHPLNQALEVYNLSEDLDHALAEVLVTRLGMADNLTPDLYAEAYRLSDNYALRVRQIDLLADVIRSVDELARLPVVAATIRVTRLPAARAGLADIHGFVERGAVALQQMGGAATFVDIIRRREMRILDRIYARDPDPFDGATP